MHPGKGARGTLYERVFEKCWRVCVITPSAPSRWTDGHVARAYPSDLTTCSGAGRAAAPACQGRWRAGEAPRRAIMNAIL
jgi:hypothetical protein